MGRHAHAYTRTHVLTHMHAHTCTFTHTYAHTCTYTQIYNLYVSTTHCDTKVGRGKAIYLIYVSICSVTCNAGIRLIASGMLGKYCCYICKRRFKILLLVCVRVSAYEHTSCVCNVKIRTHQISRRWNFR